MWRLTASALMFVITNGEDNLNRSDPRVVARSLEAAGIRVFCFKLKHDRPSSYQTEFELNLEQIVQDLNRVQVIRFTEAFQKDMLVREPRLSK